MVFKTVSGIGENIANASQTQVQNNGEGRLGVISLVAQAGYALYQGKSKLAALLAGTAVIAMKWSKVGYAVQAVLTLYRALRRLG